MGVGCRGAAVVCTVADRIARQGLWGGRRGRACRRDSSKPCMLPDENLCCLLVWV